MRVMTAEEVKTWPATKLLTEFEEATKSFGYMENFGYYSGRRQREENIATMRTEIHNRMRGARHTA